ncbi:hypothetical protein [Parasitella parasitica]|uniref:Uncharacterized protein n=1 Tax=Parasitella parasitica TaxID=35722 RepID=A0A0B7NS67_9FUNG|nr:hypothetical protein [Parasitella parasitica]
MLLRKSVYASRENKRKISETLNEYANTVGSVMKSSRLSFEDPFVSTSNASLGNLYYEHKINEARRKVKYVEELSKQDMMYFSILDFSQNNKKNILQEVLGMDDYKRFKTECITKVETSVFAGNTCKSILIQMKEAVNMKKVLKDEKEKVLAWNDGKNKQTTLWILKIVKLFYFNLKPVDYANKAKQPMNQISAIGAHSTGFSTLLSMRFYVQMIRSQMEYGLAICALNQTNI